MTEYIISDELLTSIRQACYRAGKAGKEAFTVRAPSVEIVRCRDCKHYYEKSDEDLVFCLNRSFLGGANYAETEPDGFCAWGKRREDS